jgi:hypothetical protein
MGIEDVWDRHQGAQRQQGSPQAISNFEKRWWLSKQSRKLRGFVVAMLEIAGSTHYTELLYLCCHAVPRHARFTLPGP